MRVFVASYSFFSLSSISVNFRNRAEYAKDVKSKCDNIYRKCKRTSGEDCVVVEVG